MKLFINDNPITLKRIDKLTDLNQYDLIINESDKIKIEEFKDDVLLINPLLTQLDKVIDLLYQKKIKNIDSITIAVKNKKVYKNRIKRHFSVEKAAGGLVLKGEQFLMIYRLGKWDLPKGKLSRGENEKQGAVREVEEECNIKVSLDEKICATWHTYTRNNRKVLKKTTWYTMFVADDQKMAPQVEEKIEEVRWMLPKEANNALYNSYPSIRYVFQKFYSKAQAKAS